MTYVVRPRSVEARSPSPGYLVSLYTRHTNPEQSYPPRAGTPKSTSRPSLVPPHTYGIPMRATAVSMIRRCHAEYCGSENVSAAACTTGTSQPGECMSCAAEYAASGACAGGAGAGAAIVVVVAGTVVVAGAVAVGSVAVVVVVPVVVSVGSVGVVDVTGGGATGATGAGGARSRCRSKTRFASA